MSFNKKTPPVRIRMSGNDLNKLLSKIDDDNKEIKDKLMKYTFIYEDEQVELRLFSRETECIFLLLLNQIDEFDIHYDYYKELKDSRIEYKENSLKGGENNDESSMRNW